MSQNLLKSESSKRHKSVYDTREAVSSLTFTDAQGQPEDHQFLFKTEGVFLLCCSIKAHLYSEPFLTGELTMTDKTNQTEQYH